MALLMVSHIQQRQLGEASPGVGVEKVVCSAISDASTDMASEMEAVLLPLHIFTNPP